MKIDVLDHGYVRLIESWGHGDSGHRDTELNMEHLPQDRDYECGIIEAARQSTQGSFRGWEDKPCLTCRKKSYCPKCSGEGCTPYSVATNGKCYTDGGCPDCDGKGYLPGDARLLAYLHNNRHATPFEFAGMVIEVKAPIMVFREWHRHRTQCLAGNTLIHFEMPARLNKGRHTVYKQSIEDLYKKWQPSVRNSRPERQINALWGRTRIQGMTLRCFDETENEFSVTSITDVIKGEPKRMVKVTTASGRTLTATRKHRVVTNKGWKTLGEAIDHDLLLCLEGTSRNKASGWETPPIDESKEKWRPVVRWETIYQVSDYGRVRRRGCDPKKLTVGSQGYYVVSLNSFGIQETVCVHTLVLEAFIRKRKPNEEARHKNHNRLDCRAENLEWGQAVDNADDRVKADRNQRLVPVYEEIIDVCNMGLMESYDLTVQGPYHNFIADGFVVHNSYNEMSARYAPLPDTNYIPTPERCLVVSGTNRQAGAMKGTNELTHESALKWLENLDYVYRYCENVYQDGLKRGIPKELARLPVPVGRYSQMRASTCLRNWLSFLTLRMDPGAQYEIRQFANAVGTIIENQFPQTWKLFDKQRTKT